MKPRTDVEVVAVVVTLSDSSRLRAAITSVQENLIGVDSAVVVVVNKADFSGSRLQDGVLWVGAGINLGWAGGVHAGLLGFGSEYLWAIQDDLTMNPGTYRTLRKALLADERLASVRPLPADDLGRVHPGFAGASVDEEGHFTEGFPPQPVAVDAYDDSRVGTFLPSSGQLIRRAAWDAVGGFDPWFYPWGYIDIDFGRSLTRAGWEFRIVKSARMSHKVGSSTNEPVRAWLSERNRWLFAHKWRDDDLQAESPVDPGILAAIRGARQGPRVVGLPELQKTAGIAAADCLLRLGKQLPGMLDREGRDALLAERDALRHERDAMLGSRAWRAAEVFRRVRGRVARSR